MRRLPGEVLPGTDASGPSRGREVSARSDNVDDELIGAAFGSNRRGLIDATNGSLMDAILIKIHTGHTTFHLYVFQSCSAATLKAVDK